MIRRSFQNVFWAGHKMDDEKQSEICAVLIAISSLQRQNGQDEGIHVRETNQSEDVDRVVVYRICDPRDHADIVSKNRD